jgi:uncharacterized membrane protein YphA (DoxX/SURF4 family)
MLLLRLFSTFPGGWRGAGLLLLRLAVGSAAVAQGLGYLVASVPATVGAWFIGGLLTISGASVVIGFLTPVASVGIAVASSRIALTAVLKASSPLAVRLGAVEAVAISVSLAILGAGAFSLDAYLFGRREIIIPDISSSSRR